jgi:hypothetical protein
MNEKNKVNPCGKIVSDFSLYYVFATWIRFNRITGPAVSFPFHTKSAAYYFCLNEVLEYLEIPLNE